MMRIRFLTRLFDFISPRQCPVCGRRLSVSEEVICASCLMHLPRTGFADAPRDNEMVRLFWGRMRREAEWQCPVVQAAALFRFEPASQSAVLVYALKYSSHPEYGYYLGRLLVGELPQQFFDGIEAIIPIPLARKRLRRRGYNQSEMIARGVASLTGLPVLTDVVERLRFTASQTQLAGWERMENVAGVFNLRCGEKIAGRHVLVVDDVLTTGATMMSCCNELLKAGGVTLSVLTACYTKV